MNISPMTMIVSLAFCFGALFGQIILVACMAYAVWNDRRQRNGEQAKRSEMPMPQ